jgi:hypothetical protein
MGDREGGQFDWTLTAFLLKVSVVEFSPEWVANE